METLLAAGGLDLFGGHCQKWAEVAHLGLMRGHRCAHVHEVVISNSGRPNSETSASAALGRITGLLAISQG